MSQLKDQIALVTGGSRGIGRAIVLALAQAGAKVAFVYRGSKEASDKLVEEVTAAGGEAVAFQADVSQLDAASKVIEQVLAKWNRLDILVNNAGVIKDGLFLRMEESDWKTVIDTNLGGTFSFCRAAAQQMTLKQRYGRIINISSVAATHVNAGQCNYSASKGAVNSFTRALAVELGSRNVTVNAIAPGFIETDMSEAVRSKAGDFIAKKLIPTRRLGKPEDIASAVVFLASAGASYITGQVITIDGGLSLGAVSG
ncbi:3-oxoacyl-ACP reductase family protein [Zavarzinella formosa]|uniref:3-oxoacyl-ACP reductase family protein n=1 Tax=Zavarzinella formosa TaxID=360055 RepID=UPI0002E25CAA|nr:3-oxoacyl-ACP reductase family protein [Zavarzinella formosa]